jgi:hypothetical protein
MEKRIFVIEVKVDAGRAVVDLPRNFTHGEVLIPFLHEQVTRGIENPPPQIPILGWF